MSSATCVKLEGVLYRGLCDFVYLVDFSNIHLVILAHEGQMTHFYNNVYSNNSIYII